MARAGGTLVARAGGTLVARAGLRPREFWTRRGPRTLRRRGAALSLIGLALLTVSAVPDLGCGKYGPPRRSPPVAHAGADSEQALAEAEAAEQERENERAREQGEK